MLNIPNVQLNKPDPRIETLLRGLGRGDNPTAREDWACPPSVLVLNKVSESQIFEFGPWERPGSAQGLDVPALQACAQQGERGSTI